MSEYCRSCGTHISEDDTDLCYPCDKAIKEGKALESNRKREIESGFDVANEE